MQGNAKTIPVRFSLYIDKNLFDLSIFALKIDKRLSVVNANSLDFTYKNRVIASIEVMSYPAFETGQRVQEDRNPMDTGAKVNALKFVGVGSGKMLGQMRLRIV